MKATTFAKASAGLAAAATLSFALTTAANAVTAGPTATQEDPTVAQATAPGVLVGVGSDTIQDVEYGISQDLIGPDGTYGIASWTATGDGVPTYRSGAAPSRPNGSGAGYHALEDSLGVTNSGAAHAGDVDYSRASGAQGTTVTDGSGVITEIPFAIDAISAAVPAGSPFLKTNGGKGLTVADLANIYQSVDKYINPTTGDLSATNDGSDEPIQAFLPKPTSGSRQFFLGQLAKVPAGSGINLGTNKGDSLYADSYPTTPVSPYVGAKTPSNTDVQEHDASVLSAVPAGVAAIAPFSAAKFIGYHDGKIADPSGKTAGTDYTLVPFDSAVTGAPSTGVLPYTDNGTSYVPNPDYVTYAKEGSAALTREVFNIIPTAAVTSPNASTKNRALFDTFVGKGSKFCLDSATILAYGFLTDSKCGSTAVTADQASTATVTVSGSGTAGSTGKVTVKVQSNGNGGGKAALSIAGKSYTVTIPAGKATDADESASVTVSTPTAGSVAVTGTFTPNLAGVVTTPISGHVTVSKAAPRVVASAPSVKHTSRAKVNVTVSATGLHPTGNVTVTIKLGTKTENTIANKAISSTTGKVTVTATKTLPKGIYSVYVSYTGDKNVNAKSSTKLTTLKVS